MYLILHAYIFFMKKLPLSFYARKEVVQIARDLLDKIVVSRVGGELVSGRIVETEAYVGLSDKASHSFGGRRTARNEHMYSAAGTVYVYICYGIHQMLNVVTNEAGVPDAVLIRALEPIDGITVMLKRTGKKIPDFTLTKGPGNVGKALGISRAQSGLMFVDELLAIYEDDESSLASHMAGISSRIGVESAGPDALLPYRFYIKGNKYVSGKPVK